MVLSTQSGIYWKARRQAIHYLKRYPRVYKKVKLLKKIPQPWNQFPDINHLLHHLRGCNLAKLPRGINRLLSAGCAGTWYFEWIEKMYGSVEHHTGVEFYTP